MTFFVHCLLKYYASDFCIHIYDLDWTVIFPFCAGIVWFGNYEISWGISYFAIIWKTLVLFEVLEKLA